MTSPATISHYEYEVWESRSGGDYEEIRDDSNPATLREGLASLRYWRRANPEQNYTLVRKRVRRQGGTPWRGRVLEQGEPEFLNY